MSDATAAKRRVIFQLANLRQWAEVEYTFNESAYNGEVDRNSQGHEFEESFHLEIDYAILGRRLANGSLELNLGLEQNYENENGAINRNGTSNGLNIDYNFDMLLFERKSFPITLYSSRNQESINAPFTKDYDLVSSHFSTGLALINQYLPMQINYHYNETETAGLDLDRFQSSEELRFNAYSDIGEVSTTELQVKTGTRSNQVDGPSPDTATDSYSLEGKNILNWKAFSQRQVLHSTYRMQHDSGTSELLSEQWDERLRLRLGKALETGASYGYSKTETPRQFRREKKREFWFGHQLFKSVTSRFQHNISSIDFNAGIEDNWSRQFNISYSKTFPKNSRIRLAYSYSYGEIDRDLTTNTISSIDESLDVKVDNNYLAQFDIVQSSVLVFSQDRSIIYTEGIDYFLVPNGRRLELVFPLPFPTPGGINLDDKLSIDYVYLVNNSIEYSTTINAVSASLELLNNMFRLYGNMSQTGQDLLDGEASVSPLVQQSYFQVGFEANLEKYSFGSSYSYLDSTINTEEYVEVFLNHQREKKNSVLNLRLTDRFSSISQYEGLLGTQAGTTERNSLMLNLDYRRQLSRRTTLTLSGFLADIRGEGTTQDEISLGLLLESRWYKFLLRVNADASIQFYDDKTTRKQQISLALRRYF